MSVHVTMSYATIPQCINPGLIICTESEEQQCLENFQPSISFMLYLFDTGLTNIMFTDLY